MKVSIWQNFYYPNPKPNSSLPFYQIPSNMLIRYTRKIPYWMLNYALLSSDRVNDLKTEYCFVTRSLVYVGIYDNVYSSYDPMTNQFGFSMRPPYSYAKPSTREVIGTYDIGVWVHDFYHQWGHLIVDYLSSLMYLPQEVFDQGFAIHGPWAGGHCVRDWLKLLNISAIVFDGYTNKQCFFRHLYVVNEMSDAHRAMTGGLQMIRQRLIDNQKFDQIPMTKFIVLNREDMRFLSNYDELVDTLNKEVPIDEGQKWEKFDNKGELLHIMKVWASIKVLVTVGGSQLFNSVFMHRNAGILNIFPDNLFIEQLQLAIISEFFMAGVFFKDFDHNGRTGYKVDIPRVIRHTKQVVYAVQNKKWGNTDNLHQFFNVWHQEQCPKNLVDHIYVDYFIDEELKYEYRNLGFKVANITGS